MLYKNIPLTNKEKRLVLYLLYSCIYIQGINAILLTDTYNKEESMNTILPNTYNDI